MRKAVVLFTIVLLSACGSSDNGKEINENKAGENDTQEEVEKEEEQNKELTAHIDIDDEIIGDSFQVMRTIEEAIKNNETPNEKILNSYSDKYILGNSDLDLTYEENSLVLATGQLIMNVDEYETISSERRDIQSDIDNWYDTLESGKFLQ